jgi:hypothetical protein
VGEHVSRNAVVVELERYVVLAIIVGNMSAEMQSW